jgi:hypothetical protein
MLFSNHVRWARGKTGILVAFDRLDLCKTSALHLFALAPDVQEILTVSKFCFMWLRYVPMLFNVCKYALARRIVPAAQQASTDGIRARYSRE